MQTAVRPRFTAGVALVGAGVIAASAVSPMPDIHLPDVHLPAVRTIDVGLAAAVNPLDVYGKVIQDALANAGQLVENAKPGQVLAQILANQLGSAGALGGALQHTGDAIATALSTQVPALLQTALSQLTTGNVAGAADSILQIPLVIGLPAADLLPALGQLLTKPLQNLVNVVNAFTAPSIENLLVISGLIAPLISTPAAAAAAFQNVLNAFGTGDPAAVVNAVLSAPATIVDGLLNGGYGPDLGPLVTPGLVVKAGGLLSAAGLVINEDGSFYVNTGGPIAAFQQILHNIVTTITPPAAAVQLAATDVTAVPSTTPTTLSLATAPATDTKADTAITETSGQTPAESPAATPQDATEAADDTVAKPTKESTTESSAPAEDSTASTPNNDIADGKGSTASTGETPTAVKHSTGASDGTSDASDSATDRDADVKTGNRVEPKTTAPSHGTKSGHASASHETAGESGSATGTTSDADSSKGAA